ncbi:MAG TPA: TetR/AcrR family transcriptional regulator [Solimonas sp.]|nr:TetR/AcrR family transcriptional regulator [Solimonas sp.]
MNDLEAGITKARAPLQQRGQARFELVLEAAYKLLSEEGFSGFSIPALAEQLGFTRASIYNFFPTPYAVLNELAKRELQSLEQDLVRVGAGRPQMPWQERIRLTVEEAARFYEEHPVAQLLILGGQVSDESYRAQAMTIQHLGGLSQRMFVAAGIPLPQQPVDVMVLAVELATACLRHSVLLHGHITPAFREEAVRVMQRYLTPYVRQVLVARRTA